MRQCGADNAVRVRAGEINLLVTLLSCATGGREDKHVICLIGVFLNGSACTDLISSCIANKRIAKYTELYCNRLHIN